MFGFDPLLDIYGILSSIFTTLFIILCFACVLLIFFKKFKKFGIITVVIGLMLGVYWIVYEIFGIMMINFSTFIDWPLYLFQVRFWM